MYTKKSHSCLYRIMLFAFVCACVKNIQAQDIHFSNWQMSPLNLNPANAGMYDGEGRLIFNYRNQWKQVPVPYNTFSFGADLKLNKPIIKGTDEAIGFILNTDIAGDGSYTITDIRIPLSQQFSFKKDTTLKLSFGLVAGITNLNITSSRLSYDKQWDGDAYNQALSNGENMPKQSKMYGDVSLGTVLQKKFTPKIKATVGYAIHHLNRPNISFNNTPGALLRIKHNESLQLKYSFNQVSAFMFEYYGAQQQKFREHVLGLSYYHTISPRKNTVFNVGVLTRLKDALITTVGLEHQNMRLQLSYDYNYSQFKRATNGRGGFELSFIYIWATPKTFVPKTRVCPIYM
ncbi:MAG: PorP/SprF family type IX secretion system membrane protein [Bacteroidota bacterium]